MKEDNFKKEYTYIKNPKYVENLKIMVNLLPDYFFKVPASSTGKYHPDFALNEGGLLRHTKFAARIAYEFYQNESISDFTDDEKDMMIFALILHDGLKLGIPEERYTRFDHPILMANYIKDNKDKLTLSDSEIEFIASCIETHMGPWTKDYQGNEVLKKPESKYQKFVHLCDYLASRKFIESKFNGNDLEY